MLYPKLPQLVIARVSSAALQGGLRRLLQDALRRREGYVGQLEDLPLLIIT